MGVVRETPPSVRSYRDGRKVSWVRSAHTDSHPVIATTRAAGEAVRPQPAWRNHWREVAATGRRRVRPEATRKIDHHTDLPALECREENTDGCDRDYGDGGH